MRLHRRPLFRTVVLWPAVLAAALVPALVLHAQSSITPLEAARKALLQVQAWTAAGKLDQGWAENLSGISVSLRNIKGFTEYVVRFSRAKGDPASISLFYAMSGALSGSSLDP